MSLSLFASVGERSREATVARQRALRSRSKPMLESMEERLVLSMAAAAPPIPAPPAHVAAQPQAQATTSASLPISISGINLTGITSTLSQVGNTLTGALTATGTVTGTILGQTFSNVPITVTVTPPTATSPVPVLSLHLSPISLDVLGLEVNTSEICLNITATPGSGLLGDLLSGLPGTTGPLSGILNTALTDTNGALSSLNTLLGNLLTAAPGGNLSTLLGTATTQASVPTGGAAHSPGAVTNILHLSLGPVNLSLLGLNVALDNCAGGPITVDVSAQRGPGNLLGNLLSDVAHLLDRPNSGLSLAQDVSALTGLISAL